MCIIKKLAAASSLLEDIEGTVQAHRDGHGFVVPDDGADDVYLSQNEMAAVLHKDRVRVRITGVDRRGRSEGRVLEIIARPFNRVIGRLLFEGGVWLVAPEDARYGQDILIFKNQTGGAKKGQIVVTQLVGEPVMYSQPVGKVVEVLGNEDDSGMEIEIAVRKFDMPHVFDDAVLAESDRLPDVVLDSDKVGRVDLTDIALVTIDGEDARDFDDAVYCEPAVVKGRGKKPNGWRLLVAIADVSHYVKTDSDLDKEAYWRATSVYFPRRVIPMLPEKLSNGLCSLNPKVERLCMVCDMTVDFDGNVIGYQFYPAVMYSHARFTYTQVAEILANTNGETAKNYADLVPHLLNLNDVYRALSKSRTARGAVELETTETQIIYNDLGRIEKIIPRTRNDAHKIIEECMLAANVCSADFIEQSKHDGLFRVHESPTHLKMEVLIKSLKAFGVGADFSNPPVPQDFQKIAALTAERDDAKQIHMLLLRSMSQAIYTPINVGHFGLAYEAYTHFTSPIRRYPDLLVHRVIKAELINKKYNLPTLPPEGDAHIKLKAKLQKNKSQSRADAKNQNLLKISADESAWIAAGFHCSANERRADEASRDVTAWLKCKYMKEHLGEEFAGIVTSVTNFGIFVELQDLYVEGLVHVTELGRDYFKYDEARQELRGEKSGVKYKIGTKVFVQVMRVDVDARKIDFRVVDDLSKTSDKSISKNLVQSTAKKVAVKKVPSKKVVVKKEVKTNTAAKKSKSRKSNSKSNAKRKS